MNKFLISILFSVICISTTQGMKRHLPKDTKSLIPLISEQRVNQVRLVDHDVLLDDIQNNIALHMIIDFLSIPKTIEGHTDTVYSVAIQDDKVVTGSIDRTAKIWDTHTGQLLHTLAGLDGHTGGIRSVAMHN